MNPKIKAFWLCLIVLVAVAIIIVVTQIAITDQFLNAGVFKVGGFFVCITLAMLWLGLLFGNILNK